MKTDSEIWSSRKIRSGAKYNHLFPPSDGKSTTRIRDALTEETVQMMIKIVKEYHHQTTLIAKHPDLRGRNLSDTLRKIWEFAYWHIQYKLDTEGVEELRTPARSWTDRQSGIDCDCFSIFIASILYNLKIPHSFRITKYGGNHWQHVYVIVPLPNGEYILDAVLHNFNQEKPPTHFKDFPLMNVQMLSGFGNPGYYDDYEEYDDFGKVVKKNAAPKPKILTKPKLALVKKAANKPSKPIVKTSKPLTPKQQVKVQKIKQSLDKIKKTVTDIVKHPVKSYIKYNGLVALSRNGFYLFLKIFDKKITSKIRPAVQYESQAQAQSAGVSPEAYTKAKTVYDKLKKLVIDKLQGDETVLKKVILHQKVEIKGFGETDFSLFDHWEDVNLDDLELSGLGDPTGGVATGSVLVAAMPVIIALLDFMKQSGLIGKDVKAADLLKEMSENPDIAASLEAESEEALKDDDGDGIPDNPENKEGGSNTLDTMLDFAKANPLPTALLTGAAAYLLYNTFLAPKSSSTRSSQNTLSGTQRRKTKTQKRKTNSRRTKLKVIDLI